MKLIEVSTETHVLIIECLAREIWVEHYDSIIGNQQVEYMLDKFQSKQAVVAQIKSGIVYFLIDVNNEYVGYIALQPRRDELFLSKIYLKSLYRSKGYGKSAVRFAEKFARERDLQKIVLTVNKNNMNSIKAYKKFGFKTVGTLVQDIGGGFVMDDFKMEKTLCVVQ